MSYRPHGLAFFAPTGGSLPFEFALYQQNLPSSSSASPWDHLVFVPARHAYSHSASLGNRMVALSSSSFNCRSSCVAFLQNSFASAQLTISTAFRNPRHLLGFLPITTWYSSCVVSYLARAKWRIVT